MKFGKLLQSRAEDLRSTGLGEHFLRYKALKKQLKQMQKDDTPATGGRRHCHASMMRLSYLQYVSGVLVWQTIRTSSTHFNLWSTLVSPSSLAPRMHIASIRYCDIEPANIPITSLKVVVLDLLLYRMTRVRQGTY